MAKKPDFMAMMKAKGNKPPMKGADAKKMMGSVTLPKPAKKK